ncbi:Hmgb2 [Symbiodinium natans]|uniref:Hmgb2 protein n=1 Tax=Symbiodinium natans TaxID=878477 RepID=A0A812HAD0_9DINO|nr:Hmgb2 [Symbiodinium natans]
MADDAETLPLDGAGQPEPASAAEGAKEEPAKKKRGRPKDANAPPKPKTPKMRVTAPARERLRIERPELAADLKGMMAALNEIWEQVPQEEKDKMEQEFQKEMEIWQPKWEAYKKTDSFKEFKCLKQDYLDRKEKRKFLKAAAKTAPKKPKSGYMLFSGEMRDKVKEEVMSAGGSLGDIGRRIADLWKELPESKKAEYDEISQAQKEEFRVKFAEYTKTDDFKVFQTNKAKMEGKHELRKLLLNTHKEAPDRPKNAFALFKAKHLKQAMEEHKGASAGELSKIVSDMWKKAEAEERASFEQEAAALKKEYLQKVADFKRKQVYVHFLQKRVVVRTKENRRVNLNDMPKKPKSVYALFRDDIKDEVPKGKGEGKGMSFVKNKFADMNDDEKKKYMEKEAELKQQYNEEVKTYKEGERYKEFEKTTGKIKREMKNEAMKVMALKYAAPPEPPKSPFAIFVGEKRRMSEEPNDSNGAPPKKKSREEAKAEVAKFKEEWAKLDKATKKEYEDKRKERFNEWKEQVKAHMDKQEWKDYVEEAKMLKVPVKNLLSKKKLAFKKLKNGMKVQPLPEKPDSLPTKPPSAQRIFFSEKRKEVEDSSKLLEMWGALPDEERKAYEVKEQDLLEKYREGVQAFETSDEGKEYLKKLKQVRKSNAMAQAKDKYLTGMPKKPKGAIQLFLHEKVKDLKKAKPDLKGPDLKNELRELWNTCQEEEKKTYQDKADMLMGAYEESLKEFRETENFKKYAAEVRKLSKKKPGGGGKGKGKGKPKKDKGPKGPEAPESMPKRPRNAMQLFMAQNKGGGNLKAQSAAWTELGAEGQKKYIEEAKELSEKYEQDMIDFRKSGEGKKYLRLKAAAAKKARVNTVREKYLGKDDAPKPPPPAPGAYQVFVQEKRPTLLTGGKNLGAVAKELSQLWGTYSEEERKPFEARAAELKADFDEKMKAYKSSDAYIKFEKAQRAILKKPKAKTPEVKKSKKPKPTKPKAKAKAKGKAKAKAKAKARGRPGKKEKKEASASDSDVMGSDSDIDSSSSSSDSD